MPAVPAYSRDEDVAGEPDYLPNNEPQTGAGLEEVAELWHPYRTWVSLYLRTMLKDETGEISGSVKVVT